MKCKQCGQDAWVGVETSICDKCKTMNQNTEGKDVAEAIKRYDLKTDVLTGAPYFDHMPDGQWVKYEDFARTESELTSIRAEAKPMTVEELRVEFEKLYAPAKDNQQVQGNQALLWQGFLACARLLGRVKE